MTRTGCPFRPPRALTSATHARPPCRMGNISDPRTPPSVPIDPSRISDLASAGTGDGVTPGAGAGTGAGAGAAADTGPPGAGAFPAVGLMVDPASDGGRGAP